MLLETRDMEIHKFYGPFRRRFGPALVTGRSRHGKAIDSDVAAMTTNQLDKLPGLNVKAASVLAARAA